MWKKGIRVIVSFVVVLLVWQIACTVTNANATLFPSPVKVGEEFVKLFTGTGRKYFPRSYRDISGSACYVLRPAMYLQPYLRSCWD